MSAQWMVVAVFAGLMVMIVTAIIPIVYVSIKQSGNARLLEAARPSRFPTQHRLAERHKPWAQHMRFQWIGGYVFRGMDRRFIAAWRHEAQPVFLLVQVVKGATHYEIVSVFNREQALVTTSQNAVVPPSPPGSFVQRFPKARLPEMFREHVTAHDFLLAQGHVKLAPYPVRVDRCIVDQLARTHAYVTAIPLWPLRALHWALVAPRRASHRSVPEQLAFQVATEPPPAATDGEGDGEEPSAEEA
jgi:hypothetical protein